jgi:hypothetical protein
MFLILEVGVTDIPKPEATAPAMPGGGMDMM